MTVLEALQFGREQLAASRLRYPREDTLALLGLVLGWPRIRLVTSSDSELANPQQLLFRQLVALRRSHFPIQYMSGQQEFYGRGFRVRPGVLIPRAETEVIVEEALKIAAGLEEEAVPVLDIGTGSGCIAVSLACEDPRILVTAIEPSPAALQVAELNCRRHGCRDQVSLICCELRNLPKLGKFQMIVSNPPYLDSGSSGEIDRGVLDHEPSEALFGESGTMVGLPRDLRSCGWVAGCGRQHPPRIGTRLSGRCDEPGPGSRLGDSGGAQGPGGAEPCGGFWAGEEVETYSHLYSVQ